MPEKRVGSEEVGDMSVCCPACRYSYPESWGVSGSDKISITTTDKVKKVPSEKEIVRMLAIKIRIKLENHL